MATVSLDNYLGDIVHPVGAVQLSAFLSKQHIANFLNIPYADVPTRFRRATPVCLYNLPSPYDATRYGPRCPQEAGTLHLAMSHLFERVSEVQQLSDETKCLNLNIYTPPSALGTGASPPLPVFVWIHGGAFNAGDNTVQFDGNHLVKRSVEINQPIVVVVVNYRLNLIGALSSRELNEGAKALGETPIPNQDLHDQRTALQWVQSYIHHFGGDPARVTLCGESAGAYSVLCHLKGGVPLFQQALIQSPPLPPLRTPEEAQAAFDKLVISAGSSLDASSTDKLAAIRSLSAQQLVHLFDGSFSTPIEDPNWFAGYDRNSADISAYWADVPSWCSRVILGNTQDETALMLAPIANLTAEETIAFTKRVTPQVCVPASLATSPRTKRELIGWSSDQAFISPLMNLASAATAQSPATRFYVYRISCPDPFPGPLRGYAWHSYGIPFTFNQPACRTYPELATVQDEITSAFLKFAHGCEPWKAFDDAREVMRWSEKGGEMVGTEDPNSAVRQVHYPSVNPSGANYKRFMRPETPGFTPGYGCVFSIELDNLNTTRVFYDNLNIHKSVHLGAPFTLAFAYTMCAYQKRLDWVAQFDSKPTQIRISVGLEDTDTLVEDFRLAVEAADKAKKTGAE